ncbi:unnamed protein product, partial [Discosporangium mesarthrocarpum]
GRGGGWGSRSKTAFYPEALVCVANLIEALGDAMSEYIDLLLEPMFSNGLSEQLIETLSVLSKTLPAHQQKVHERLLLEVAVVLSGEQYFPPGSRPPWESRAHHVRQGQGQGQ